MSQRPTSEEYLVSFEPYVSKVPEEDVLEVLQRQGDEIAATFAGLPAAAAQHAYAPGKWKLVELVGHLVDTERIMAYRALCFARGEQQALPPFDENLYAENANYAQRQLPEVLEELRLVRAANLHFFRHLAPADWERQGNPPGRTISVRALAWVIAGHIRHHLGIIRERYLPTLPGAGA